jgi:hypothetical protein
VSDWVNRITGYGEEEPEQLLANGLNPRRHDRHQREVMEALLREVGFVQDIIVNTTTGNLIDGHMRVELAIRAGQRLVPVKYVELPPEQEAKVIATLDATTDLAEADPEAFEALLREVTTGEAELQAFLSTLAENNGVVPDDRAGGQDMEAGSGIEAVRWANREVPVVPEERDALIGLIDAYKAEQGALSGFVTWLLDRREGSDAGGI